MAYCPEWDEWIHIYETIVFAQANQQTHQERESNILIRIIGLQRCRIVGGTNLQSSTKQRNTSRQVIYLPVFACCIDHIHVRAIGITVSDITKPFPSGLNGICLKKKFTPSVVDEHLKRDNILSAEGLKELSWNAGFLVVSVANFH